MSAGTCVPPPSAQLPRSGAGRMWCRSPREQGWWAHHEDPLLLGCLEAAMAKLGGGVNELELDVLQGPAAVVHQEGLQPVGEGSCHRGRSPLSPSHYPQPTQEGLTHPASVRTSPSLLSPSPPLLKQAGGQPPQLPQGPWGSHSPAHHPALTFLSVMILFLVPAMQPFSMTKSLLTSP